MCTLGGYRSQCKSFYPQGNNWLCTVSSHRWPILCAVNTFCYKDRPPWHSLNRHSHICNTSFMTSPHYFTSWTQCPPPCQSVTLPACCSNGWTCREDGWRWLGRMDIVFRGESWAWDCANVLITVWNSCAMASFLQYLLYFSSSRVDVMCSKYRPENGLMKLIALCRILFSQMAVLGWTWFSGARLSVGWSVDEEE